MKTSHLFHFLSILSSQVLNKCVSKNTLYYEMTDTNPQFVQKFLWLYDLPLLHN